MRERDSAADYCCSKHTANDRLLLVFVLLSRGLIYSMYVIFFLFAYLHPFLFSCSYSLVSLGTYQSPAESRAAVLFERGSGCRSDSRAYGCFWIALMRWTGAQIAAYGTLWAASQINRPSTECRGGGREMEDGEKARGKEGRGILSVKETEIVERGRGGDWETQRWG